MPNTTPHTSHLTPHSSHLAPYTSHLTPHTSHLTPHTLQVAAFTQAITACDPSRFSVFWDGGGAAAAGRGQLQVPHAYDV
jgi:hypothetical protein